MLWGGGGSRGRGVQHHRQNRYSNSGQGGTSPPSNASSSPPPPMPIRATTRRGFLRKESDDVTRSVNTRHGPGTRKAVCVAGAADQPPNAPVVTGPGAHSGPQGRPPNALRGGDEAQPRSPSGVYAWPPTRTRDRTARTASGDRGAERGGGRRRTKRHPSSWQQTQGICSAAAPPPPPPHTHPWPSFHWASPGSDARLIKANTASAHNGSAASEGRGTACGARKGGGGLLSGGGGGGGAQGLGIKLFAFGGAYWPLATAHSDPLWVRTCFGHVNEAPG